MTEEYLHASIKEQYSLDSKTSTTPWIFWEVKYQAGAPWEALRKAPNWEPTAEYRRKTDAIIPKVSDPKLSPWGVACGQDTGWETLKWKDAIAETGVQNVRGFADYPARFADLEEKKFRVAGILQWTTPNTALTFPVNDIAGWKTYITGQITKYNNRVHEWEVWNEPPNFSADISPISYATIVKEAYNHVKATHPHLEIGLTAKSVHLKWLAEAIEGGAKGHYDYITLHPYETAAFLKKGWEKQFLGIVPTVRKMLAAKDPAKVNVPIDFTEIGIPANWPERKFNNAVEEEFQANLLVKFMALSVAQGVRRVSWFEAWDGDSPSRETSGAPFGLIQRDGRKRPAYYSFKNLISSLGQVPKYLGMTTFGGDGYGLYFDNGANDGSTVMVAWSNSEKPFILSFSDEVKVMNPVTGQISTEKELSLSDNPVFLTAIGDLSNAWRVAAAKFDRKPKQEVKTISLVAGAPDQNQGIYIGDPPPLEEINGVKVYPCNHRTRTVFSVDPDFLSWDSKSITITAVCHNRGTTNAGFGFKYESNVPMAQADGNNLTGLGWKNVNAGAPRTITWTITNPQFIAYFGFNFIFDSDALQYSDYAVEKITITKN